MLFGELTAEQAEKYRDHIIARERPRLSDLAFWMYEDGGPVGEMNSSRSSLVPLWRWFRDFRARGLPGVELAGLPSVFAVYDPGARVEDYMREAYVKESLEHYFAKVIFGLDAGARWTAYESTARGAVNINHREIGVTLSTGRFVLVNQQINHVVDLLHRGQAQGTEDTALERKLDRYDGWIDLGAADGTAKSILSPFLDAPRIPAADPSRTLPTIKASDTEPPEPQKHRVGGSVMLVGGHQTDVDLSPGRLPALPAESVAAALSAVGFVGPSDTPVQSPWLLRDGATFEHLKGWAAAWTSVRGEALRTITIRALDADEEEWKALLLPLREFAASIDATLD